MTIVRHAGDMCLNCQLSDLELTIGKNANFLSYCDDIVAINTVHGVRRQKCQWMGPGKWRGKLAQDLGVDVGLVTKQEETVDTGILDLGDACIYNQKTLVAKAAEAQNDQAERIGNSWEDCEEAILDGGELSDLIRDMYSDFEAGQAFNLQMPALTSSYLEWSHATTGNHVRTVQYVRSNGLCKQPNIAPKGHFVERMEAEDLGNGSSTGTWRVHVVDVFCTEKVNLVISADDSYITSTLMRQGFMLCSPIRPSMAITINALELYRVAHLCSLHFSIQAFVKTICDLQGVAFQHYLSCQFSIMLNLYLNILNGVEALIMEALSRTSDDWHLQHACPACTYKLKDKPHLKFKILYAMDGNDSLKHILHHIMEDEDSHELPTTQKCSHSKYTKYKQRHQGYENPCAGHWKNMDEQKMKQTWGVYDETGIFLAIFWHGMSLLIADMVQSGELAKYPIAIVSRLMKVFGADLGGGYDIGCQLSTTLAKSIIGKDIKQNRHTCLAQHFMVMLTSNCDWASKTLKHARGHSPSLMCLHPHYAIICKYMTEFVLPSLKHELGVTADTKFTMWLQEEQSYLEGLEMEPLNETLQMEYWQALVNLEASKKDLDLKSVLWDVTTPSDLKDYATYMCKTQKAETAHWHAIDMYNEDLHIVQDLKSKLNIDSCWTPKQPEWHDAAHLVTKRTFQHALDHLEALIIMQIFELLKMNCAGTRYKMQKHIVKVLQVHSSAICIALEQYNTAAHAMDPPHCILKWDEVAEYAFITEFDLLRDAWQDLMDSDDIDTQENLEEEEKEETLCMVLEVLDATIYKNTT
ncbi:hypothetical protein BKA82DRAFT_4016156 [Pisolithus tinctorius]|nr:hypothetical protein BKA82DRAFT_4016156 [Pisolithus tinctorius]